MDLLQKELQRKKEALAKAKSLQGNSNENEEVEETNSKKRKKYIRQGDLRRMEEEEEERRKKEEYRQAKRLKKLQKKQQKQMLLQQQGTQQQQQQQQSSSSHSKKSSKQQQQQQQSQNQEGMKSNITESNDKSLEKQDENTPTNTKKKNSSSSGDDVISSLTPMILTQKLRSMGLIVRYFGESHKDRLERLESALKQQNLKLQGLSEMEEFRLGKGHGIRNPFLERDNKKDDAFQMGRTGTSNNNNNNNDNNNDNDNGDENGKDKESNEKQGKEEEDDDNEDDPPKKIYKYLKGLLKEWEHDLSQRTDIVARSVAGRNESKTLKQCKDYIRPLFKLLKQRKLEEGLQHHLLKIVDFAKEGEFVKAHDEYMNVAIGRAAWPIGVTMVGIHARSGRAKIESSNVAHVMNSELQRKYLTSVKRLLSYAQKKRTDVDPSKKVC